MAYGNQFKLSRYNRNMKKLINSINELKKTDVSKTVNQKTKEFRSFRKKCNNDIFKEMCFCLLTANFNAAGGIKIQDAINDDFLKLSEKQLASALKKHGHRFPNARANYICEARKSKDKMELSREWLIENIKGLGMKEASHFLRNIGFDDYAIIDFHIIDLLENHGIIERPKTLTKNKYLEIEEKLREIARKTNLTLSELDMYLWYLETGKILK